MKVSNQFGLAGQSDFDYNYFVGCGRRGRKRRRRAERSASLRRPLKNVEKTESSEGGSGTQTAHPTSSSTTNVPATPNSSAIPEAGSEGRTAATGEMIEKTGEGEHDNFLGLGKTARERRKLKNEERKAGIERMRAETAMMQNMAAPSTSVAQTPVSQPIPVASQGGASAPQPGSESFATPEGDPAPQPAEKKSNTIVVVAVIAAVVIIGGGLLLFMKPAPVQVIAQP